jgi:hypothetical protein
MLRSRRPPVYSGMLANVSETGRLACPGPRIGSTDGNKAPAPEPPAPPAPNLPRLDDPKKELVLIPGAVVSSASKLKVRTVGQRADRAAATLNPADIDVACCDCNPALTCRAMSQVLAPRGIPRRRKGGPETRDDEDQRNPFHRLAISVEARADGPSCFRRTAPTLLSTLANSPVDPKGTVPMSGPVAPRGCIDRAAVTNVAAPFYMMQSLRSSFDRLGWYHTS